MRNSTFFFPSFRISARLSFPPNRLPTMYHSRRSSRSGDEHLYTTAIDLDLNPSAYLDDEKGGASSSNESLPMVRGSNSKWTSRREKPMSPKTKSILQAAFVVLGFFVGWTGNEWTRFLVAGEGASDSLNALNRT